MTRVFENNVIGTLVFNWGTSGPSNINLNNSKSQKKTDEEQTLEQQYESFKAAKQYFSSGNLASTEHNMDENSVQEGGKTNTDQTDVKMRSLKKQSVSRSQQTDEKEF